MGKPEMNCSAQQPQEKGNYTTNNYSNRQYSENFRKLVKRVVVVPKFAVGIAVVSHIANYGQYIIGQLNII